MFVAAIVLVVPNPSGMWENIQRTALPSAQQHNLQSEMRQNCTKQVRSKRRAGSGLLTSWQAIHLLDCSCPGWEHSEAHLGPCPLAALAGLSLPNSPVPRVLGSGSSSCSAPRGKKSTGDEEEEGRDRPQAVGAAFCSAQPQL